MSFPRIVVDPARMQGMACFRDTRVTVSAVLGQLAAGRTVADVLADHPQLELEDGLAALAFAAASLAGDSEFQARLRRSIQENRAILERLDR